MFLLQAFASLVLLIGIPSATALPGTGPRYPPSRLARQAGGGQGNYKAFDFYMGDIGAIRTDLMVGATDGDGNRQPRSNCIFYVNQRPPMTEDHRDWAKKRAIEFSQLMNAADLGGDYVSIPFVFIPPTSD